MDTNQEINKLKQQLEEVIEKNKQLEEQLHKYQHTKHHIKYYENNSDKVKERAKNYMTKLKETDPEKIKAWRHNAYIKRKEKLKQTTENNDG